MENVPLDTAGCQVAENTRQSRKKGQVDYVSGASEAVSVERPRSSNRSDREQEERERERGLNRPTLEMRADSR